MPDENALDSLGERAERCATAIAHRRLADAEAAVLDLFAAASEACEQNPSPDWPLIVEAAQCEERGDWQGAERAYRQILALPDSDAFRECRAHVDLSKLFRVLDRDDSAWEHACLATAAARQTGIPLFQVEALVAQVRCCLRRGRVDDAVAAVDEAFSALGEDPAIDQMRAQLLIVRAECAVRQGRLTEAGTDLNEAFALLEPLAPMTIAAGVHANLAHGWSVRGDLRSAQQDREGAIAAWSQAVAEARHVASLPHVQDVFADFGLAYYLRGLAVALTAGSRTEDAQRASEEREAILRRRGVPSKAP